MKDEKEMVDEKKKMLIREISEIKVDNQNEEDNGGFHTVKKDLIDNFSNNL